MFFVDDGQATRSEIDRSEIQIIDSVLRDCLAFILRPNLEVCRARRCPTPGSDRTLPQPRRVLVHLPGLGRLQYHSSKRHPGDIDQPPVPDGRSRGLHNRPHRVHRSLHGHWGDRAIWAKEQSADDDDSAVHVRMARESTYLRPQRPDARRLLGRRFDIVSRYHASPGLQ